MRKSRHRFERANPQCVDFDGLPGAGRHYPVADFCVHPRELNARTAGVKKSIGGIDMDVVASARDVRLDHAGENRKKFLQRRGILGCRNILPDGFEKPERSVDGVVFRLAASIREIVGEHPAIHVS